MKKKILALDMDGTLLNSRKEITPATRAALRKIMEEGHRVILSSGRPTPGLRPYERELELDRYGVICFPLTAHVSRSAEPERFSFRDFCRWNYCRIYMILQEKMDVGLPRIPKRRQSPPFARMHIYPWRRE